MVMGGGVNCVINYCLSKKFKLIKNDEFTYQINILKLASSKFLRAMHVKVQF
jgi:hypothetical protein